MEVLPIKFDDINFPPVYTLSKVKSLKSAVCNVNKPQSHSRGLRDWCSGTFRGACRDLSRGGSGVC